jgi:hypothetical protein
MDHGWAIIRNQFFLRWHGSPEVGYRLSITDGQDDRLSDDMRFNMYELALNAGIPITLEGFDHLKKEKTETLHLDRHDPRLAEFGVTPPPLFSAPYGPDEALELPPYEEWQEELMKKWR